MKGKQYSIQYATMDVLGIISVCHMLAFPMSLITKLGKNTVVDMLKWYLSAPNKFLFYIKDGNEVIGYCGGYLKDGTDQYGSGSGMTQSGFKSAALALVKKPWLLLHPEVIKRYGFIAKNVLRKLGLFKSTLSNNDQAVLQELGTAGLVVIGVHPQWQGKGVGTQLQIEFETKARLMGAKRLQLSVRTNNTQAIKSYQRNGYTIQKEEGPSYVMVKNLS